MLFLEESVSSVQLTNICCVRAECAQTWGMDSHPYSETRWAGLKATVLSSSTSCPMASIPALNMTSVQFCLFPLLKSKCGPCGRLCSGCPREREAQAILLMLRADSFSFGLTGPFCCWSVDDLCPTLCDPMDRSPPGSSVHGIPQARILDWAAVSSSRGSSWPRA